MDVPRLNANLALTRRDHTRAVRPDQAHTQLVALDLNLEHIQCRNAFGDADDELDPTESRFEDRVLAERRRHVDHRGVSTGGLNGLPNGIEYRQTEVHGAALARRDAADHLRAVGNGLLGVEGTLRAGEALANDLGVLVDQYAHYLPSAALTT